MTADRSKTRNALGLIIYLGALPFLGGVTGRARSRYTQSTGERIDDRATSSRVSAALADDRRTSISRE
jgi:hypothetical protein